MGRTKTWLVLGAGFAVAVCLAPSCKADRRSYVWTYEYLTMPKGAWEIEYYLTTKVADTGNYAGKNSWESQVEYEYGLTDKWDVALYQRWQQTNTAAEDEFEYTGTKLRTRYRFGERGAYPVDALLYLEYIRPDGSGESEELEGKLVLAKDFGKLNIAYNQIIEAGIDNQGAIAHEYALGIGYERSPAWRVGLESTGNLTKSSLYLGPTVSWGCGRIWLGAGVLGGLNERSDDLRFRLIVGIPF